MLSKNQRLTKKTSFDRLVKNGAKLSTPNFFVKYLVINIVDKSKKPLKIAVSVGTKISKLATERNRLRRRVLAAVREQLEEASFGLPVEILIVPKKSAEQLKTAEISQEIKLILNKTLKNG